MDAYTVYDSDDEVESQYPTGTTSLSRMRSLIRSKAYSLHSPNAQKRPISVLMPDGRASINSKSKANDPQSLDTNAGQFESSENQDSHYVVKGDVIYEYKQEGDEVR